MQDVPPFDTAKATAEIRVAGGFGQEQAEAIVGGMVRGTEHPATHADLERLGDKLQAAIDKLQAAIDGQTKELRVEVQRALNAQTWRYIGATGALLALMRWLFPA